MTDPRRLLEEGASDFEVKLLRAGRGDAPSTGSRRRIMVGLGVGGILTTTAVTTGANASIKGWLAAAGGGTLGALAIWSGVEVFSHSDEAPRAVPNKAVAAKVTAPARAREVAPPPVEAAPPVETPVAAELPAVPDRPVKTAPAEAASLNDEIAVLEEARRALSTRDYGLALRTLDGYSKRFPRRKMGSEATVLRIETLAAKGDDAAARELGRAFLRATPRSPYAKRVRSLIGEP
jgi:TolA-binding protein